MFIWAKRLIINKQNFIMAKFYYGRLKTKMLFAFLFLDVNKVSVREQSETDSRNLDVSDEINYIGEIHSTEQDRQDISECFQSFGISSLKVHAHPLSRRVNLGNRKRKIAISTIQEKVARALNITPDEINVDTGTTEDVDLLTINAENVDRLMQLIKEKLSALKTNR